MRRIIGLSFSTITLTAIIALATSVSASAWSDNESCLDPKNLDNYSVSFTRGTGTISLKDNKPLCEDAELYLQSFQLPDSWDGKGWNTTAIPQTLHAAVPFTIPKGEQNYSKTLSIDVPDVCYATQLDFYLAPKVEAIINFHDGEDRELGGKIFKATGECEEPKMIEVCKLSVKEIFTIKEKDFDPSKHSKNLDDCKEEPVVPEEITVCELSSKETITIKEDAFSDSLHSKDLKDCDDEEEVVPPAEQPEVLPSTGAGGIAAIFGASTAFGTAAHYLRQRFGKRS